MVLEKQSSNPDLWENPEQAQALMRKIGALKSIIESWNKASTSCNDLGELYEMAKLENSEDLLQSIETDISELEKTISEMEFRKMLDGTDDACPALLTIHPGAGGTESQDWALMLFRMYMRFLER